MYWKPSLTLQAFSTAAEDLVTPHRLSWLALTTDCIYIISLISLSEKLEVVIGPEFQYILTRFIFVIKITFVLHS